MKRPLTYILDEDGNPQPERSIMKWAAWWAIAKRRVALDRVGDFYISTIFLGLNMGRNIRHPVLWETMIFRNGERIAQFRCGGNWKQAEAMHAELLAEYTKK